MDEVSGKGNKDIKKLGELLSNTIKLVKIKVNENRGLRQRWKDVVSKDIAEHTRIGRVKGSILYVKVDSATWLHYISAFKKKEMLESIQKEYKRKFISDIRFYVGTIIEDA